MYVWSEGGNFRISMVGGIAYCQVYDRPGTAERQRALFLGEMAASARKLLDRGLRPLGLILDLRRTPPVHAESGKMALGALLARWEKAALPVAILVKEDTGRLSSYLRAGEVAKARSFPNLAGAECWIRNREHGRRMSV